MCRWQDLVNETMSLQVKEQPELHFLAGEELIILSKNIPLQVVS
jgi:hypothetical protein